MADEKKLGLPSVIATGVGLIVATSCLLSCLTLQVDWHSLHLQVADHSSQLLQIWVVSFVVR